MQKCEIRWNSLNTECIKKKAYDIMTYWQDKCIFGFAHTVEGVADFKWFCLMTRLRCKNFPSDLHICLFSLHMIHWKSSDLLRVDTWTELDWHVCIRSFLSASNFGQVTVKCSSSSTEFSVQQGHILIAGSFIVPYDGRRLLGLLKNIVNTHISSTAT